MDPQMDPQMDPDIGELDGHRPPQAVGVVSPLAEVARGLLDRPADVLGEIDLSAVAVVTPGGRAGRQLLLEIDRLAAADGIRFIPPLLTTAASLDQVIGIPDPPVAADDATALAALARGLEEVARGSDPREAGWMPTDPDPLEHRAIARRILDADRAVRAGGRDWDEVTRMAERLGGDGGRYRGLQRVVSAASAALRERGLVFRDEAIEQVVAVVESDARVEPSTTEIVLVGVVDLGPRDRRLLTALARRGVVVRPLLVATDEDVDRFDDWGTLRVSAWQDRPPVVPMDSVRIESRPMDVAAGLVDWLQERQREAGGRLDPDDVAIVVADESMGETIRRELDAAGVGVHLGQGRSPLADGPARTLERLAHWCDRPDSLAFGGLLSDPAIEAALRADLQVADVWADWSGWAADQMPRPVDPGWFEPDASAPDFVKDRANRLAAVDEAIRRLLHDLPVGEGPAPSTVRVPEVLDLLARIDRLAGDASPWSDVALRAVRTAAERLAGIPLELAPQVTVREAMLLMLDTLAGLSQPDPGRPDAVETIGWVDAAFDPAPGIAVLGLHDAAVPGTAEDPWLPDTLRRKLGLEHADLRTARDAWVLSVILGRDPHAAFLLPREDGAGERLTPSRLLFGDRGPALAARVTHLFRDVTPRVEPGAVVTAFPRMRPPSDVGGIVRPTMSVTEFRLFLQSPYRYWLRHALRLDAEPPAGRELDARHFGTVLHAAVEEFGRREIERLRDGRAPSIDVDDIHAEMRSGMRDALHRIARGTATPGLRIQERILDQRLRRTAEIQSARTLEGWRVHAVEWAIDRELDLPDGTVQRIKGRIDRIDRHDDRGWMLLDFKTSDSGKRPDPAHRRRDGTWIDLQLPLYRWAAVQDPQAPDLEDIRSGYFVVGGRPDRIGLQPSKTIDPLQEEAMDTAREIVRAIRVGLFDHLGPGTPYPGDPVTLLMRSTALAADEAAGVAGGEA